MIDSAGSCFLRCFSIIGSEVAACDAKVHKPVSCCNIPISLIEPPTVEANRSYATFFTTNAEFLDQNPTQLQIAYSICTCRPRSRKGAPMSTNVVYGCLKNRK
jgi:hypothetical protein